MLRIVSAVLVLTVSLVATSFGDEAFQTALRSYVSSSDPAYTYDIFRTKQGRALTGLHVRMTSQEWKKGEVTPSQWKHWMTVFVPKDTQSQTSLLMILGGDRFDPNKPPVEFDSDMTMSALAQVAVKTKSVITLLHGVPAQPLKFHNETIERVEDDIIAYSLDQVLKTKDPTWAALLPMTKSATQAMNTVQALMKERNVSINHFVLTGSSKRGWTTWLAGAVDPRVSAIAPIVFDFLNMPDQIDHQLRSYGTLSEALKPYKDLGLAERAATPEGAQLVKMIDPFDYLDNLKIPKLMILASGDEYWTVDSSSLYYPRLIGPKHLHYEANADHDLENKELSSAGTLSDFYVKVLQGKSFPSVSWTFRDGGEFEVKPDTLPRKVILWTAESSKRDFRLKTIGKAWKPREIPATHGLYTGKVEIGNAKYKAFYLEFFYPSELLGTSSVTTEIKVLEKRL